MRTSATLWPSTAKQRAVPGARASRAQTRRGSPMTLTRVPVLQLVDHRATEPSRQRADREPLEHVVEEAEHDQPLGVVGRDAAALEVVELVVVDGSDGRRVGTLHV